MAHLTEGNCVDVAARAVEEEGDDLDALEIECMRTLQKVRGPRAWRVVDGRWWEMAGYDGR